MNIYDHSNFYGAKKTITLRIALSNLNLPLWRWHSFYELKKTIVRCKVLLWNPFVLRYPVIDNYQSGYMQILN